MRLRNSDWWDIALAVIVVVVVGFTVALLFVGAATLRRRTP